MLRSNSRLLGTKKNLNGRLSGRKTGRNILVCCLHQEKEYSKQHPAPWVIKCVLASFTAYAAASPPPRFHVIMSVIGQGGSDTPSTWYFHFLAQGSTALGWPPFCADYKDSSKYYTLFLPTVFHSLFKISSKYRLLNLTEGPQWEWEVLAWIYVKEI